MHLWQILVPTVRNGKPIRTRYHRVWDSYVRSLSGGLTILRPAKGQWVHPVSAELVEERMIPVLIACSRADILQILEYTKSYYEQDLVMASKVSEEVLFV